LILEQALGKTGQKSGFSPKSKEAVPKTEVLEQPQFYRNFQIGLYPGGQIGSESGKAGLTGQIDIFLFFSVY
jgi:hypothetical protein